MSEPIFPAPGGPGFAAPTASEPEVKAKAGNRRALIAVGGALAAVAVGAGVFFLLTSGGSDPAVDALAPIPKGAKASATATAPAPVPTKAVKVVPAKLTARDPFVDLFPEPTATAAAAPASSAPAAAPSPSTVQQQTTTYTIGVTAIDPTTGAATVTVGSKAYPTTVGTKFASYFTLYAVFNAKCVGVLLGDQNVPVCLGTPAIVTQ